MTIAAGVDLGGTKIQTVVLRAGKVAGMARELTPQSGSDDVIAAIVETIRTSISNSGAVAADLA
jgi:predicted NBD/HSP70 family sugar kinase